MSLGPKEDEKDLKEVQNKYSMLINE